MGTGSIFPRRKRKQKRRDESRLHGRDEPELAMELDRHDDSEWARGLLRPTNPKLGLEAIHTVQRPCPKNGVTILYAGGLLLYGRGRISFFIHRARSILLRYFHCRTWFQLCARGSFRHGLGQGKRLKMRSEEHPIGQISWLRPGLWHKGGQ